MGTSALMNTYGDRKLTLEKGEGVWVWDSNGKKYLDALAGIAVCGLGHAHPNVTRAISEQAAKLIHCSNLYNIPIQKVLGEKLREISGMTNVFFGNSGAEANEAAIKIARLYGNEKGVSIPTVVVMKNSFHGRTLATLTATGNRKVQAGFEPLVRGFSRAPFNDIAAVEAIVNNNSDVVAVLVEPIQGEGGIRIPDANYLHQLRSICDRNGLLLMLDEIQTGSGRTGKFFNYQHAGILPDVVTVAKGLGNGVPIGACLANGAASELLKPGKHGTTFGGNPLVCSAALATIETIEKENLAENAAKTGAHLLAEFKNTLKNNPNVVDIRGQGLMLGIELKQDCPEIVPNAAAAGLLVNVTAGNVIRLLPPLIITTEQADQIVKILTKVIAEL